MRFSNTTSVLIAFALSASSIILIGSRAQAAQVFNEYTFTYTHKLVHADSQITCEDGYDYQSVCGVHGEIPHACTLHYPGNSAIDYTPASGDTWLDNPFELTYGTRMDEHGGQLPGWKKWDGDFFGCDVAKPIIEPLLADLKNPKVNFHEDVVMTLKPSLAAGSPDQYAKCALSIRTSAEVQFDDKDGKFEYSKNDNGGNWCPVNQVVDLTCEEVREIARHDLTRLPNNWSDDCHGVPRNFVSADFFKHATESPYTEDVKRVLYP